MDPGGIQCSVPAYFVDYLPGRRYFYYIYFYDGYADRNRSTPDILQEDPDACYRDFAFIGFFIRNDGFAVTEFRQPFNCADVLVPQPGSGGMYGGMAAGVLRFTGRIVCRLYFVNGGYLSSLHP